MRIYLAALIALTALAGCSDGHRISATVAEQFDRGDSIDLSQVGPATWDRVCVLGPYSINKDAEAALGFPWDAEANTSIAMSDGVNVLVFAHEQRVVAYTEHPRNKGDFSRVNPSCMIRSRAKLVRRPGSAKLAWEHGNEA